MNHPKADVVSKLLEDLIGSPAPVQVSNPMPELAKLETPFVAVCVDDAKKPVCALIADLRATVSLGGTLLMLPQPGLEDQVDEKSPAKSVVEAVSEVFNNLTSTLNRIEGNPHIVSMPARPLSEVVGGADLDWMSKGGSRTDYAGSFCCGNGRLIVVSR